MKLILGFLVILAFAAIVYYLGMPYLQKMAPATSTTVTISESAQSTGQPPQTPTNAVSVVAQGLDTPWAIAFLSDGSMLITERPGRVRFIDAKGKLQETPVATIADVKEIGEGGLLGIALHPNFMTNKYVYLYYTYNATGNSTMNKVVRMKFANNQLRDETVIIDSIPGSSNHNGGRIKFGPDGNLYIGTGDAENPSQAQNTNSVSGKILRITPDGKPVADNPFHNAVYSYGHRNVQGLGWDSTGSLWATEHGRSGISSGLDELNLIQPGKNYGWPTIEGDETRAGMVTPVANSGPNKTWAPSGMVFIGNSLFFGGLRGTALFEAVVQNNKVTEVKEHVSGDYGRIRDVVLGPDQMLYFTTSNRDGRGKPSAGDDRIVRVDPKQL